MTPGCRQDKQVLGSMDFDMSNCSIHLRMEDLPILAGLLTGHAELNQHLTPIKVKSDALRPL